MSRSRKKNPIHGATTCRSEAEDKRIWHGRMRVREKQRLRAYVRGSELDDYITTHFRDVSNPWDMGKDGRRRWTLRDAMDLQRSYEADRRHGTDWVKIWKRCCLWK